MSEFFEIDFLEVHTAKSGDALAIRYEQGGIRYIDVVDGGYAATGEKLVEHIDTYYEKPSHIDNVVVTHPDRDHAEGIISILENYSIGTLWVLFPWDYVDQIMHRFDRYTNADNLRRVLREAYPYISEIERVAARRGITICEPFQGAYIGAFTVLAPTQERYFDLVVTSAKTPKQAADSALSRAGQILAELAKKAANLVKAAWGDEYFPADGTSNENEMSVVQFSNLAGQNIVLTADSGRDGLNEAADYAPFVGLALPGGVNRFQIPHHGGRHNVSTELLDRWFGEKLPSKPQTATFTAVVSAAEEDEDHPRKSVIRGFTHRGAKILTTEGRRAVRTSQNAPDRAGWTPAIPVVYPDEMED